MPSSDPSLTELYRLLRPSLPALQYLTKPTRLLLQMGGGTIIQVDIPSDMPQGLRVALVVDYQIKGSPRRQAFCDRLRFAADEVENILGCVVADRVRIGDIATSGQPKCCKIGHHRRMGVHVLLGAPRTQWRTSSERYHAMHEEVIVAIEGLISLSERFPVPTDVS